MLQAADAAFARVPILDAWDETPSLRALRLDLGALSNEHRAPGQVVRARPSSDGGEGYFALASAPQAGPAELLLKRGGAVADHLIAASGAGGALEVSAPFGRGFPVEELRGRDVLLFAAGSGIGAIRALVQHLVAVRPAVGRIALWYGQRDEDHFAYRGEHASWERAGVRVRLCCSQPGPSCRGARGRVQEVARDENLGGIEPSRAVACLCGMKGMVTDVRALLAEAGMPAANVHLNY